MTGGAAEGTLVRIKPASSQLSAIRFGQKPGARRAFPQSPRSARSLAAGNRIKSGGAIPRIGFQGVRTSFSVSYHFLRFVQPYLWKPNKL